jgi:hypothetical protein
MRTSVEAWRCPAVVPLMEDASSIFAHQLRRGSASGTAPRCALCLRQRRAHARHPRPDLGPRGPRGARCGPGAEHDEKRGGPVDLPGWRSVRQALRLAPRARSMLSARPWGVHRRGAPFRGLHAACQAIALPGRRFHDFRRTAMRKMGRAGIPERVTPQIAGHNTRSMFERYHMVSASDLRGAARQQAACAARQLATKTVAVEGIAQCLRHGHRRRPILKFGVPRVGLEPTRRSPAPGF